MGDETNLERAKHYADSAGLKVGGMSGEGVGHALVAIAYALIELAEQGQKVYWISAELEEGMKE
jgi:hypothetical protein